MAWFNTNISKLGFGLMRLPRKGDTIDIEETTAMVDRFLASGGNYFDTAWAYPGSEEAIREALVRRHPRSSYFLATKLSAWRTKESRKASLEQFQTSLSRTGTDYFDFYLLHNVGGWRTDVYESQDIWSFAQELKQKGLIRHLGFSFHSSADELDAVLSAHPETEFVQLQINYADWDDAVIQSRRCYETARRHNRPIIIMEPVKGGLLATPPDDVAALLHAAQPRLSTASWALRFAAGLEGVMTVLSGMSSLAQMDDNIATMQLPLPLDAEDMRTVERARQALAAHPVIQCTACGYCTKVCPTGVGIPQTFHAMNLLTLYGNKPFAAHKYRFAVPMSGLAGPSHCLHCGKCESVCPQHLPIRDSLARAAAEFDA